MALQNFTMHSGDSKTLNVSIVDNDGSAVDVSTATAIAYKIARTPTATADVSKSLSDGVSVSTSTVTVTLDAADTAALSGVYYHEMQVTDASSNVFTALSGYITIEVDLI